MFGVLVIAGLTRSLQFTAINTLAVADVPDDRHSQATSFTSVVQQVSASLGVTIAALSLDAARLVHGGGEALTIIDFQWAFITAGAVAFMAAPVFLALPKDAGAALIVVRAPTSSEKILPDSRPK
jgi:hypothetical protein